MDDEKYKDIEIECAHCGEQIMIRVYDHVDESDKEMILSRSLNRAVCSNCDTEAHVFPPVLYSDTTHKVAIVMNDWADLLPFKKSLEEETEKEPEEGDEEIETLYYVDNEDDLITAIMCIDNNVNYEVAKLLLHTMKNEYIGDAGEEIDYLCIDKTNKDGELLTSIVDSKGKEKPYKPFPMDRYQEYLTLYKDKLEKAKIFVMNETACEFFFNHIDDIDSGKRKSIKIYNVLVADCAMFAATSSLEGVKEGDMVTFIQKSHREVPGECVCIQDIDTISIGRELSLLENISDYYTEGGYC